MIPVDIRLYTWLDVEEVFGRIHAGSDWPSWLRWVRVYWDGAFLGIAPASQSIALEWLTVLFDPRFDLGRQSIVLEALSDAPRLLPVLFEETEEVGAGSRFLPTLSRPTVLYPPTKVDHPAPLKSDDPPVVLFHSFKGGVGRTLHAFAMATLRNGRPVGGRTLLVDGDLEAPGLSWLLRSRIPTPPISYADFLSLVHSDPDPEAAGTIALVANRLRDSLVGETFVLPSFRSMSHFHSLEIRPEHLLSGSDDPFRLTTLLSRLGQELKVEYVIVDARAGLSEISAGLLLDPRVYRVLVTTLTSQSVEGTAEVLELIGRIAPSIREDEPIPGLIVSQIPDNFPSDDLGRIEQRLLTAAQRFIEPEQADLPIVLSNFDPTLAVLPESWDEVVRRVDRADFSERLSPLYDWLPRIETNGTALPVQNVEPALREKRLRLASFASDLVFAESGNASEFLNIRPLRNLTSNYTSNVPIAVVIGAKGAGKTYTYLQMARRGTWRGFASDAGVTELVVDGFICPVLQPKNLQSAAKEIVQDARIRTARELGFSPPDIAAIYDYVRDGLRRDFHEGEWRERWLDIIAWSVGMEPGVERVGRRFVDYLRQRGMPSVAIFDGLEDLFQELLGKEREQTALRALLQDLPEWLEQQPLRPLGLVVVVRQDMVAGSIKQNAAQLMSLYEPYALKWGADEALRLVNWIAVKGEALPGDPSSLLDQGRAELVAGLEHLWGRKLGSERSKEARSADWVIAALSDLKGQIQARDVVRFLATAADESAADSYWKDRLLVPNAIRSAVRKCGVEKVREIAEENFALRGIFGKLQDLPIEARLVPFSMEQVGLGPDELKILEDNGGVVREGSEYYMAEIFRVGLDFRLRAGARPRVLTLARRTRHEH